MLIDIASLSLRAFIKFSSADEALAAEKAATKFPENLEKRLFAFHSISLQTSQKQRTKNSNDFPSVQMFVQNTFQIEMHYSDRSGF